jgi:hypothetical protein
VVKILPVQLQTRCRTGGVVGFLEAGNPLQTRNEDKQCSQPTKLCLCSFSQRHRLDRSQEMMTGKIECGKNDKVLGVRVEYIVQI